MGRSSVDSLPLAVRARLAGLREAGKSLAYAAKFVWRSCGVKISTSALSRWHSNESAQRLLRERVLTEEIMSGLDDDCVSAQQITRLFQQMVAHHVAEVHSKGGLKTDELALLGRIIKDVAAQQQKSGDKPVEVQSEGDRLAQVREIVSGS